MLTDEYLCLCLMYVIVVIFLKVFSLYIYIYIYLYVSILVEARFLQVKPELECVFTNGFALKMGLFASVVYISQG